MPDAELMSEMKQLQADMLEKVTVTNTLDLNPVVDGSMGFCSENLETTVGQFHLYSGEPADPSNCTFENEDFKDVQIDKTFQVSIKVLDLSKSACPEEQSVTAELHHLQTLSVVQQRTLAKTVKPGQYLAEMFPKNRGRHMLAVKVNGRHIYDSPSSLFVHMPPQKLSCPVAIIDDLKRPGGLHKWNGKILACEHGNNRLVRLDKNSQVAHEIVGLKNGPCELSSDLSSNIYVTTIFDNCLHKFDKCFRVLKTIGSHGKGKEQFNFANGVNVSGNHLYVCDDENHRIKVYDLELNLREIIGKKGTKVGQFQNPADLAFDREGNMYMYVVERENSRIQVFSPQKKPLREYSINHPITVKFCSISILRHGNENGWRYCFTVWQWLSV